MISAGIVALAYLLGSIPFGYLIVRLKAGTDIRESGSGGTGATNVTRRVGKAAGIVTLLLDAAKGATAIIIARMILGLPGLGQSELGAERVNWVVAAAAVAVLVGHIFPVWLHFKGGKGVATAIGVFLLLAPLPLFVCGILFVVVVGITRYVSLGSLIGATALPFLIYFLSSGFASLPVLVAAVLSGLLIILAHRGNLRRLVGGTENRFK